MLAHSLCAASPICLGVRYAEHRGSLERLSAEVSYRYGARSVAVGAGDSPLLEATALHGIEAIQSGPVSYLSVVFTLRG